MKPKKDKLDKNYKIYKVEVSRLEKKYHHRLTPQIVVKEAYNKKNPLHNWFDWNDTTAGEKWRLHQARMLLASIKVKIMFEEGEKKYKKYLNVRIPIDEYGTSKRFYVGTKLVLKSPDLKIQVLNRAIKEAEYWQRTYQDYQELENIFRSIERTKKKLKK